MSEQENKRGTTAMDPQNREEVARKGGETVSQDREHMAEIGRKGGETSGGSRQESPGQQGQGSQGRGGNLSPDDRAQSGENSRKTGQI